MAKKKAEAPEAEEAQAGNGMSKTDAVRAALAEGIEKPMDGVNFVKERFGIEMTNARFSQAKLFIRKREQKGGGKGSNNGKPERSRAGNGVANGSHGSPAELAMAVKKLVQAHGAEAVAAMTKVFAD